MGVAQNQTRRPSPDKMLHVAVTDVGRRRPEGDGGRERQQRDEGRRVEHQRGHADPVPGDRDEEHQHDGLQPEVHEPDADRSDREDLARERDLLHEARVVDHGAGPPAERCR